MHNSVLLVDIGNSFVKYQHDGNTHKHPLDTFKVSQLPKTDSVCIASVVEDERLLNSFKRYFNTVVLARTQKQHHNLINGYDDYTQLGVDRWLALMAVYQNYPNNTVLIVSVGSALTFDLLADNGHHQGGWIMPGINWLKRSHPAFVSDGVSDSDALATNTAQAWHNGCRLMLSESICARIAQLKNNDPTLQVVMTGGGVNALLSTANPFNFDYQHHDNLVLMGLNIWHNECLKST